MKREWNSAEINELDVRATAFGPQNPSNPDSEKTQIVKPDGTEGWEQFFGEGDLTNMTSGE